MKKFITILTMLFVTSFIFAEKFEVKSVSGTVTYEASAGKWDAVKKGQKLSDSTTVNTSIGAKLVVVGEDGQEITIKAMQNGTLDSLVKANKSVAKTLKKNPSSTLGGKSVRNADLLNAQGEETASSRSTDLKDDYPIDE